MYMHSLFRLFSRQTDKNKEEWKRKRGEDEPVARIERSYDKATEINVAGRTTGGSERRKKAFAMAVLAHCLVSRQMASHVIFSLLPSSSSAVIISPKPHLLLLIGHLDL